MPFPAIIAIVGGVAVVAERTYNAFSPEINSAIGKYAAEEALERGLGIKLDLDGVVNKKTITEAINRDVLGGEIQFSNLFDRDSVRADLKRIALDQAAGSLGFSGTLGVQGIRDAVMQQVAQELAAELEAQAGPAIDAAQPLVKFAEVLARPKDTTASTIRDTSPQGESNRARQAKYRAGHKRVWRIKPGVEL